MPNGIGVFVNVDMIVQLAWLGREQLDKRFNINRRPFRYGINLDAITGREQNYFVENAAQFQRGRTNGKVRLLHRQLLAQRDRRGLMTESSRKQFHITCARPRWTGEAEM